MINPGWMIEPVLCIPAINNPALAKFQGKLA
jgi:hypothetical protein